MDRIRFIKNTKTAKEIWEKKAYYRLNQFLLPDLVKIFQATKCDVNLESRRRCFHSFVNYFSSYALHEVTSPELNSWFQSLQKERNLTERTLNQVKSSLNPFFQWLEQESLLEPNPLNNIKFRRNQKPIRPRVIFSTIQLLALLEDAKKFDSKTFYPFLYAIIHTGARRSEIMTLTFSDVELERNLIILRETKNGDDRRLYIKDSLASVIKAQNRNHKFVFTNNGKELGRGKVQRMINEFKELYPNHGDWNYHDLRHSFAYNFLVNGGEMYQLQAILGHKTIQMTVDLYGNYKSQDIRNPSPYDF